MSTDFTIESKNGYAHVKLAPDFEITSEGMSEHWRAISIFCRDHGLNLILSETEHPPIRALSMNDAYLAGTRSAHGHAGMKMACLWKGFEPDETTHFLEMVTLNRGMLMKFCASRKEALAWLGVEEE